jgi:small GTP-binding protein
MSKLELVDVIHRSMDISKEDVVPLVKYLDMKEGDLNFSSNHSRATSEKIAKHFRQMGSNDFSTLFRGGEGVSYSEIVVDVGEKLGAKKVSEKNTVEENEKEILNKLFSDTLEKMSVKEKSELFRSMGIKERDLPVASSAAAVATFLLKQYGGFATYRISLIVANMVSRALLGSGLSFATNAALTRAIGTMLGPIGWIASGVWLAIDIAGPAYRKTVPAVIHIAMLRQVLANRITIGVVGDGSSGKDSLIHAVFDIDTNIDPVAGSTKEAMIYPLREEGNAHIINYPGFNDYRERVNKQTDDSLNHTDVFVMVVDISRGVSGSEAQILRKLETFGKPILICLNKVDLVRSKEEIGKLMKAAEERLGRHQKIETVFDPDPRLGNKTRGCQATYEWIRSNIIRSGKDPKAVPPYQGSTNE